MILNKIQWYWTKFNNNKPISYRVNQDSMIMNTILRKSMIFKRIEQISTITNELQITIEETTMIMIKSNEENYILINKILS
jgi:hypothetical protein